MAGGGYRLLEDYGWECCLVDGTDTVYVDLHRNIAPDVYPGNLGFDHLWHRCKTPATGGIRTFCVEDMLVLLCIQLRKDTWEKNDLRLVKLCDIAELLRRHPTINWDDVNREATRLGCQRALWVGLAAAHELLGAPVDLAIVESRRSGERRIAGRLRWPPSVHARAHRRCPGRNSIPGFASDGATGSIRGTRGPGCGVSSGTCDPSPTDRAMVSLPARLGFLYYLVRPIRVGRDYAKTRFKGL